MVNSSIIVIRSANERTAELCVKLCEKQSLKENLIIVQEVPFEIALRKCYEAGVLSCKKWMITVDADVLLSEGTVDVLVQNAEQMPQNFFQLEGRVFDKITGRFRQAGHRVYRTEFLPLALEFIPSEGEQIRPEYHVLQRMNEVGYPSRRIGKVVGLHDFEQNFVDLYRKSFVHAVKHPFWVVDIIQRCSNFLHEDYDYLFVLKGIWDGLVIQKDVSIDKRKYEELAQEALASFGLQEKIPIKNTEVSADGFQNIFTELINDKPIPHFDVEDSFSSHLSKKRTWQNEVYKRISTRGILRGILSAFGGGLIRLGKLLDK